MYFKFTVDKQKQMFYNNFGGYYGTFYFAR